MQQLTQEQRSVVESFDTLDKIIKQLTLPVEQGVALANAFGKVAASVDYLMGTAAGLVKGKPKHLEAVPAPDTEYDDAVAQLKEAAAEAT